MVGAETSQLVMKRSQMPELSSSVIETKIAEKFNKTRSNQNMASRR